MSALTYSEKLRDPRWQRKRLEVMNRDLSFSLLTKIVSHWEVHLHRNKKTNKIDLWIKWDKFSNRFIRKRYNAAAAPQKFHLDFTGGDFKFRIDPIPFCNCC